MEKKNKSKSAFKKPSDLFRRNTKSRQALRQFLENLQDQQSDDVTENKQITQCVFLGALRLKPVPDTFQVTLQPISFTNQSNASVLYCSNSKTVNNNSNKRDRAVKNKNFTNPVEVKKHPRKNSKNSTTIKTNVFQGNVSDQKPRNRILELFNNKNISPKEKVIAENPPEVSVKLDRRTKHENKVKYKIKLGGLLKNKKHLIKKEDKKIKSIKKEDSPSKSKSVKEKTPPQSKVSKDKTTTIKSKDNKPVTIKHNKKHCSETENKVPPLKIRITDKKCKSDSNEKLSSVDNAIARLKKNCSIEVKHLRSMEVKSKEIPLLVPVKDIICEKSVSREILKIKQLDQEGPNLVERKPCIMVEKQEDDTHLMDIDEDDEIEGYLEIDQNIVADLEALIPDEEIQNLSNKLLRSRKPTDILSADVGESSNYKHIDPVISIQPLEKINCDLTKSNRIFNTGRSKEIIKIDDIKEDVEIEKIVEIESLENDRVNNKVVAVDNKINDILENVSIKDENNQFSSLPKCSEINKIESGILEVPFRTSKRKLNESVLPSKKQKVVEELVDKSDETKKIKKEKQLLKSPQKIEPKHSKLFRPKSKLDISKNIRKITDFLFPDCVKTNQNSDNVQGTQINTDTEKLEADKMKNLIIEVPNEIVASEVPNVVEVRTLRSGLKVSPTTSDVSKAKKSDLPKLIPVKNINELKHIKAKDVPKELISDTKIIPVNTKSKQILLIQETSNEKMFVKEENNFQSVRPKSPKKVPDLDKCLNTEYEIVVPVLPENKENSNETLNEPAISKMVLRDTKKASVTENEITDSEIKSQHIEAKQDLQLPEMQLIKTTGKQVDMVEEKKIDIVFPKTRLQSESQSGSLKTLPSSVKPAKKNSKLADAKGPKIISEVKKLTTKKENKLPESESRKGLCIENENPKEDDSCVELHNVLDSLKQEISSSSAVNEEVEVTKENGDKKVQKEISSHVVAEIKSPSTEKVPNITKQNISEHKEANNLQDDNPIKSKINQFLKGDPEQENIQKNISTIEKVIPRMKSNKKETRSSKIGNEIKISFEEKDKSEENINKVAVFKKEDTKIAEEKSDHGLSSEICNNIAGNSKLFEFNEEIQNEPKAPPLTSKIATTTKNKVKQQKLLQRASGALKNLKSKKEILKKNKSSSSKKLTEYKFTISARVRSARKIETLVGEDISKSRRKNKEQDKLPIEIKTQTKVSKGTTLKGALKSISRRKVAENKKKVSEPVVGEVDLSHKTSAIVSDATAKEISEIENRETSRSEELPQGEGLLLNNNECNVKKGGKFSREYREERTEIEDNKQLNVSNKNSKRKGSNEKKLFKRAKNKSKIQEINARDENKNITPEMVDSNSSQENEDISPAIIKPPSKRKNKGKAQEVDHRNNENEILSTSTKVENLNLRLGTEDPTPAETKPKNRKKRSTIQKKGINKKGENDTMSSEIKARHLNSGNKDSVLGETKLRKRNSKNNMQKEINDGKSEDESMPASLKTVEPLEKTTSGETKLPKKRNNRNKIQKDVDHKKDENIIIPDSPDIMVSNLSSENRDSITKIKLLEERKNKSKIQEEVNNENNLNKSLSSFAEILKPNLSSDDVEIKLVRKRKSRSQIQESNEENKNISEALGMMISENVDLVSECKFKKKKNHSEIQEVKHDIDENKNMPQFSGKMDSNLSSESKVPIPDEVKLNKAKKEVQEKIVNKISSEENEDFISDDMKLVKKRKNKSKKQEEVNNENAITSEFLEKIDFSLSSEKNDEVKLSEKKADESKGREVILDGKDENENASPKKMDPNLSSESRDLIPNEIKLSKYKKNKIKTLVEVNIEKEENINKLTSPETESGNLSSEGKECIPNEIKETKKRKNKIKVSKNENTTISETVNQNLSSDGKEPTTVEMKPSKKGKMTTKGQKEVIEEKYENKNSDNHNLGSLSTEHIIEELKPSKKRKNKIIVQQEKDENKNTSTPETENQNSSSESAELITDSSEKRKNKIKGEEELIEEKDENKNTSLSETENQNLSSEKNDPTADEIKRDLANPNSELSQNIERIMDMEYGSSESEPYRRIYRCRVCLRVFETYNRLKAHKRVHDVKNPYQCQECGKCYDDVQDLAAHLRIHKGKIRNKRTKKDRTCESSLVHSTPYNLFTDDQMVLVPEEKKTYFSADETTLPNLNSDQQLLIYLHLKSGNIRNKRTKKNRTCKILLVHSNPYNLFTDDQIILVSEEKKKFTFLRMK